MKSSVALSLIGKHIQWNDRNACQEMRIQVQLHAGQLLAVRGKQVQIERNGVREWLWLESLVNVREVRMDKLAGDAHVDCALAAVRS